MLILVCDKYYVLETKNIGDMIKFSEPEQPSYYYQFTETVCKGLLAHVKCISSISLFKYIIYLLEEFSHMYLILVV